MWDATYTKYSTKAGITVVSDSHIYEQAGDYEIVVALTDDDGTDNASMHVVV